MSDANDVECFGVIVDGVDWSIADINKEYRKKRWPGSEDWLIFSIDLAGNPFGFDRNGSVWLSDQESGEVLQVAPDFEEFILRECLELEE